MARVRVLSASVFTSGPILVLVLFSVLEIANGRELRRVKTEQSVAHVSAAVKNVKDIEVEQPAEREEKRISRQSSFMVRVRPKFREENSRRYNS